MPPRTSSRLPCSKKSHRIGVKLATVNKHPDSLPTELIDEPALVEAALRGQIGAAGLDVVAQEPVQQSDPLVKLPHVFVTPPIAGFPTHMLENAAKYVTDTLKHYRAGQRPASLLNGPGSPRHPLGSSGQCPRGRRRVLSPSETRAR